MGGVFVTQERATAPGPVVGCTVDVRPCRCTTSGATPSASSERIADPPITGKHEDALEHDHGQQQLDDGREPREEPRADRREQHALDAHTRRRGRTPIPATTRRSARRCRASANGTSPKLPSSMPYKNDESVCMPPMKIATYCRARGASRRRSCGRGAAATPSTSVSRRSTTSAFQTIVPTAPAAIMLKPMYIVLSIQATRRTPSAP